MAVLMFQPSVTTATMKMEDSIETTMGLRLHSREDSGVRLYYYTRDIPAQVNIGMH